MPFRASILRTLMPTSGLVITANRPQDIPGILAALESHDSVSLGTPVGVRLPLVTETASKAEDKALWDWLWSLSGVAMLDVAFIHLGDTQPGDTQPGDTGPGETGPGGNGPAVRVRSASNHNR